MEIIKQEDIDLITTCAKQDVNDDDFSKLKIVYEKLGYLCTLLQEKGYETEIRKDPRKQAGQGIFKFQDYQWAKVYPKGMKQYCSDKFSYIIGLSDSLNFHMMGLRDYQKLKPSLNASQKAYTEIDLENITYNKIVDEFIAFEKRNNKLFIETASKLNIKEAQEILKQMEQNTIIDLLKYKHQIILQGSPGTGKTRLAKEIAKSICVVDEISENDILEIINVGLDIHTPTKYNTFKILEIGKNFIKVKPKDAQHEYNVSFKEIIDCYNEKKWQNQVSQSNQNGTGPYLIGIVIYLVEHISASHYKIIQFHPSYTYEDFVRGISVKSEGENLSYEAENKVLIEFAEKALKNLLDSEKQATELSKEIWVSYEIKNFADTTIQQLIDTKGDYSLTDNVSIISVQDDAFIYNGHTWKAVNGHRMKFSDLEKAYLANANSRQEYKKVAGISKRAIEHCSYDFKLLMIFREYLEKRPPFIETSVKTKLKNYVLIIDEINRANLSSVLGELIYALEYRNEVVECVYELEGERNIILPKNLKIIGTMNTADRSVGHIDYAIRRRFAFVDVLPDESVINEVIKNDEVRNRAKELFLTVSKLFIEKTIDGEEIYLQTDFKAKDVQLGHSYFLAQTMEDLNLKLHYEIKPLLLEYIKDGVLSENAKSVIDALS